MTTNTTKTNSNRPLRSFKSGLVQAAVWLNVSAAGNKHFTVSVSRSYSIDANGTPEWRTTYSFGPDHLVQLKQVIASAEKFISEQTV